MMFCTVSPSSCFSQPLLSVSFCNILVARCFVLMPDLILLLFHFEFRLSGLPTTVKGISIL